MESEKVSVLINNSEPHEEYVYLNLLRKILTIGKQRVDRTGTGTISIFGERLEFNISDSVPLLTTKQMGWKTCIRELLWFLRGDTNAKHLQQENVHIWDFNTTRAFLDNRGLTDLPEGDLGAGYGFQWRHFGAEYKTCDENYNGQGTDQIQYILDLLKNDPTSRRIYMSAWNPAYLHRMALVPCHISAQFYVDENKLSCHMYQRSVDCGLGLPFNIFSYTVLTYILAKKSCLVPDKLIISTGDTHIYNNHIDQLNEQITRTPYSFPTLTLDDSIINKPFEEITISDFQLHNYHYHPSIKMDMSA